MHLTVFRTVSGELTRGKFPLVKLHRGKFPLVKFPRGELRHGILPGGKLPRGKLSRVLFSNYFCWKNVAPLKNLIFNLRGRLTENTIDCIFLLIKYIIHPTHSTLTLSWRRPLSYRNQSIDLRSKSMDWILYDNGLRHERVNKLHSNKDSDLI